MIEQLPAVNATLNTIAFILLVLGYRKIKAGQEEAHKKLMIAAFGVSALFLCCYLTHKYASGDTKFTHEGFIRYVYFFILATHVPLATLMVIPILLLIRHGLKGNIDQHRKLARWTFPVWIYVSITGVLIYFMLYQWYPPSTA